jgi:hypothetical protein
MCFCSVLNGLINSFNRLNYSYSYMYHILINGIYILVLYFKYFLIFFNIF